MGFGDYDSNEHPLCQPLSKLPTKQNAKDKTQNCNLTRFGRPLESYYWKVDVTEENKKTNPFTLLFPVPHFVFLFAENIRYTPDADALN